MSVNSGLGKVHRASVDLGVKWDEIKSVWRDQNSRKFEEDILTPLLARLRAAEAAMGQMEDTLYKLRRDCE